MAHMAISSKSGQSLIYQMVLIFLMVWEFLVGWAKTAVDFHAGLIRLISIWLDRFTLLSLWGTTAVPYAAYPLSCCLLE